MIGFLRGQLLSVDGTQLLLLVAQLGYEVTVTELHARTLEERINDEISLYIHTHVREDEQRLFGFVDNQAKQFFRVLIRVNSVGVKLAMTFLSTFMLSDLVAHIANNDIAALCRVPGVGKKSAQRLALELQDKLHLIARHDQLDARDDVSHSIQKGARSALLALGFTHSELDVLLPRAWQQNTAQAPSIEGLVRLVLKASQPQ